MQKHITAGEKGERKNMEYFSNKEKELYKIRLENTLTQSMPEAYGSQEAHYSFPPERT